MGINEWVILVIGTEAAGAAASITPSVSPSLGVGASTASAASFYVQNTVSFVGVSATGFAALVSPSSSIITIPAGVVGYGGLASVLVWGLVDENQTPGWQSINEAQTPSWQPFNESQTPVWVPVVT